MRPTHRLRRAAVVCSLAAATGTFGAAAPAAAQRYEKDILFAGVKAGAKLEGGALIETWAGPDTKKPKVKFHPGPGSAPPLERLFTRADANQTGTKAINGATLDRIIKPVAGVEISFGTGWKDIWKPEPIDVSDAEKGHKAPNYAAAGITVQSHPKRHAMVRRGTADPTFEELEGAVESTLDGAAHPGKPEGKPTDEDKHHSAFSFGGVYVQNAETFTRIGGTSKPFVFAGKNKVGHAGMAQDSGEEDPSMYLDPFFLTVEDLTTGATTTSEIMRTTMSFFRADAFIDEVGIRLAIDRHDPRSSVSYAFSSETPWVTNPFRYGFTLDGGGLTVDGDALSLADWVVTTTDARIEATYAFGPGGMPYDLASVLPPDALFTDGHDYAYHAGAAGGAFGVASVPEPAPATTLAAALGVLGLATRLTARRRQRAPVRTKGAQ